MSWSLSLSGHFEGENAADNEAEWLLKLVAFANDVRSSFELTELTTFSGYFYGQFSGQHALPQPSNTSLEPKVGERTEPLDGEALPPVE